MPEKTHPLRPARLWLWSLVGWSMVGLANAVNGVVTRGDPWGIHLEPSLRHWLPWALCTPLIFLLVDRLPLDRDHWKRALPAHLLCAILIFGAGQLWESAVLGGPPDPGRTPPPPGGDERSSPPRERAARPPGGDARPPGGDAPPGSRRPPGGPGRPRPMGFDLLHFISLDLPIYLMLLTAAHAGLYYRREQERAAALAEARLDALRGQLQPHFLFNSLNMIGGLIHENPDKADTMLVALSDLLRRSLETSTTPETPLAEETAFLRRYLELMQARFEDRLEFSIELAPDAAEALVPSMILQPIVENALKHGLLPKVGGGTVTIGARRHGAEVVLTVADDGIGFAPAAPPESGGLGLANTRARLRALYGKRAALTVRHDGGTTVTITLPAHIQ